MKIVNSSALSLTIAAAIAFAASSALAAGGEVPEKLPSTSIVPASGSGGSSVSSAPAAAPSVPAMPPVPPPPAPAPPLPASAGAASNPSAETPPAPAESAVASTKPKSKTTSHRPAEIEVEPAKAQVRLVKDDWVYTEPSKSSKHIERVHAGKFINITGSTRSYLRVSLKSGETGYLDPSAVELVKSTDKIFTLTRDAAVLEKPNKWSKKLAEVHRPHPVHVVGVSLDYAKIRMRNGTEGYIPLHALE